MHRSVHTFFFKKKVQGAIQQVRGAEGAPNLLDSGPGFFLGKIKMCAPGGAHICIFKKKLAEIEKGCPLCFGISMSVLFYKRWPVGVSKSFRARSGSVPLMSGHQKHAYFEMWRFHEGAGKGPKAAITIST